MTAGRFNELLHRMSGDKNAFSAIYYEYVKKMRFVAMDILRRGDDVDDAVQTAFLKLIEFARSGKFKRVKYPAAFMHTLIRNVSLDIVKKRKPEQALDGGIDVADVKHSDDIATERLDVSRLLGKLPEPEREIAIMFYVCDMTIRSVASELGISESAVKRYKKQIRKKLSEYFDKSGLF